MRLYRTFASLRRTTSIKPRAVAIGVFDGVHLGHQAILERARAAADAADKALAEGRATGPLHGVPMTLKESYDIEGLPTTWGIPEFRGNVATSDSEVARRYRNAGAVLLGKTNVPRELADFQSYNEIYGTTNNPWDLTRTAGGSSGGSLSPTTI